MAFVTLEDLEGVIEVTVFADLYSQARELLHSGEPVFISGVREGDKENPKVLAQEICPIHEAPTRFSKEIHIRISTTGAAPAQIADLKRILHRHRGGLPVTIHVTIPNRTETIVKLSTVSCEPSEQLRSELGKTFGDGAASFEDSLKAD
ncbi:MAG: hypothetical protein P8182_16565 [Deltaproteobacteria bacterium]